MRQINFTLAEKISFTAIEHTHAHNFGHLILPLQGTLFLRTNQQVMTVNDQHLLLLPPDCVHTYYAKERNEFLVLFIPGFMFSNNYNAGEARHLELDSRWHALRYLMLSECQGKKADTAAINHLLHYSFRVIRQNQESPSIRYIHEYYYVNISLEALAGLEHYNVSYYSQWFQKKMGVTPQTYIQQVRLNEAKRLLRETNFSILDIAQQVGYEYQASLTRLFKRFEGTTPCNYRRQFYK
ncbi:AraC-type DNA-binding protein [Desulfotomaculum arcticum]|uniref:AraC-type DNA-binding protein n=1 Tax=Desulfotruncus arcticus DSM 17038 TaxID=1121424 RepID=A0A1I2USP2_9FIRM|nr:helix-turn-helix domain-containing protein [Desulfotruncus arcticus]SFG79259.1 AraC-type DNA-binding protein [Desulfotomaculum arcticum] [Desulfotruncus arcticus DSM 17038]